MAFQTPLRLPLSTGDSGFGAAAATGLSGAVAFAPLFLSRYLPPWAFWVAAVLVGLWLLLMIALAFQMWAHRASDVRLDGEGFAILSGPRRGQRLTWSELAARGVRVAREGEAWELRIGGEVFAHTREPEEGASLESLAATLRAGGDDRAPDAPVGPEVSKCKECGAPLVPSGVDATACRFCGRENVLPERVRHVAGAAGAGVEVERAVRALLRWPRAGRSNAWLVLSFVAASVAWPFFAASALVAQSRAETTLLDLAVLFTAGICAGLTFPSLLALGTTDRRSFELLSARFAAAPPPGPDEPYGCRHCGGPLPEPHGRSTTPAVAICAYCESSNVVGLGLAREARAARSDAESLSALAEARLALRRRRRLRAILPALLVLWTPLQYADVMFELPCVGPVGSCTSPHEARWCVGGERTAVRCGGPRGCARDGLSVFCDQSVAADGELCLGPPESVACTEDSRAMLRCSGDRYGLVASCRGPRGCYLEGGRIHCDTSVAAPGEACEGDAYACAGDGHALLRCEASRWTELHPADTCAVQDGRLVWTGAYAVVGERCAGESVACTADGRMLRCRDRALAAYVDCHGPQGCWSEGTAHHCDQSIASVGDPCGVELACSRDGRARLVCRDGVFAHERPCPGGCTSEGGRLTCRLRQ